MCGSRRRARPRAAANSMPASPRHTGAGALARRLLSWQRFTRCTTTPRPRYRCQGCPRPRPPPTRPTHLLVGEAVEAVCQALRVVRAALVADDGPPAHRQEERRQALNAPVYELVPAAKSGTSVISTTATCMLWRCRDGPGPLPPGALPHCCRSPGLTPAGTAAERVRRCGGGAQAPPSLVPGWLVARPLRTLTLARSSWLKRRSWARGRCRCGAPPRKSARCPARCSRRTAPAGE